MKAFLKNYRQSPRKVRLVADVVRGKNAEKAMAELSVINKKAAQTIRKVLHSAIANAKQNFQKTEKELFVQEIRVDEGVTLKRRIPRAFGRSTPINKRTSRITLALSEHNKKNTPIVAEKIEKNQNKEKTSKEENNKEIKEIKTTKKKESTKTKKTKEIKK